MTAPTAAEIARAVQALTAVTSAMSDAHPDTLLPLNLQHARTLLAALAAAEADRDSAAPERPLRFAMRGDAARTVVLLYAAGDGNDLHGEVVATMNPPFAGSGGGPTSAEWRAFVDTLVGAWNARGTVRPTDSERKEGDDA